MAIAEFASFEFQDASQQEAEQTAEGMDMDLLIGPMKLRTHRHVFVVFDLAEGLLDFALAAIGLEDLFVGPLLPIGNEDALAEDFVV